MASLALTGCFTSEQPFYEDSQIIRDARMEGKYSSYTSVPGGQTNKDNSTWLIRANGGGRYDVYIRDYAASILLVGTLFQVEKSMFLDLYPITDSGVHAEAVSVSELIRKAFYARRHVVWKVELSDTGLRYSVPYGNGTSSAARQAPELKCKDGILELRGPTKESQKYLLRFADDPSVFNVAGELRKEDEIAK